MSTSFLYHAFGLYGYDYVSSNYKDGNVIFTIRHKSHNLRCSACGSRHVVRSGSRLRRFRTIPKLKKLSQIAIDEIAVRKGYSYLTIVMDLKTGAVVFVGNGKGANALKPSDEITQTALPRAYRCIAQENTQRHPLVVTKKPGKP